MRASNITEEMKLAAANAIASVIPENDLSDENIIPNVFHPDVMEKEGNAVTLATRMRGSEDIVSVLRVNTRSDR